MARARNIKPGYYANEELAACSVWARYIFPGLWMLADREGRLEYRPMKIKGELLRFDNVEAEPLLLELAAHGLIVIYEVDGCELIQVVNFTKHQRPHQNETPSDFAPWHEGLATKVQSAFDHGEKHFALNPSLLNPESCFLNPESLIPAKTPLSSSPKKSGDHDGEVVQEIFEYWKNSMNSPRAKLDAKREKAIKAALTLGYEPRQLCQAIRGCSRDPWSMGDNDRGHKFNGIELILRDAGHIDKFIGYDEHPPTPKLSPYEERRRKDEQFLANMTGRGTPEPTPFDLDGEVVDVTPKRLGNGS